jgi:predicted O-linked N-acetylglucosamine transferase (SPINDLY family)
MLSQEANSAFSINKMAIKAVEEKQFEDAELLFNELLSIEPKNAIAFNNCGMAQMHQKKYTEALHNFTNAIKQDQKYTVAHWNLGRAYQGLGQHDKAINSFKKAIDLDPEFTGVYQSWAESLKAKKQLHEANVFFDKAIALDSKNKELYFLQAEIYEKQKKIHLALKNFQKIIEIEPRNLKANIYCGHALRILKRYKEAIEKYKHCIDLSPKDAKLYFNLALCQKAENLKTEAIQNYKKAIEINSQFASAHHNLAALFHDQKKYKNAIDHYQTAFQIDPEMEFLLGNEAYAVSSSCNWKNYDYIVQNLTERLCKDRPVAIPFPYLALVDDPALHQKVASVFVNRRYSKSSEILEMDRVDINEKIRIGYFSSDFYNHATLVLMTEFFKLHSRHKFEIIAFSFDSQKKIDQFRNRVKSNFDQFLDVSSMDDDGIVALSRSMGIHIAVDLKGYTKENRCGIFLKRAAPIQVNYLGYPGTMGTSCFDYIIADRTVIPEEYKKYYTEKVVYMPDSYQVNDQTRPVSEKKFTRKEMGLPEDDFVYCCFNNNYKITPETFDSWVRIIKSVPKSILWLLEDNEDAKKNLTQEFVDRGVDQSRIVFAKRISVPEHLARQKLADLSLDTLPYNAHTTASDALWVELPLVTLMGKSFPARVAASLLKAVGLEELITYSRKDFEALAIDLATDPKKLQMIKKKLVLNRQSSPLFNTQSFVNNIELAYQEMINLYKSNKGPKDIDVAKLISRQSMH